jgi:hypothetical protein
MSDTTKSATPALPICLEPPLKLLKSEFDSIAKVLADLDGQIATSVVQRARLQLVSNALSNELDRLRIVESSEDKDQLLLDFGDEVE